MKKSQLPETKKLHERAHDLKLKADGLIKEADALMLKAEEIEKTTRQSEDVNQAAARIVSAHLE